MAFVAIAIGGAAALGTGASIYGGMETSNGVKGATAAQMDANSLAQQTTIAGQRDALAYLDPFRQFGLNAGSSLQDLMYSPEQRAGQIDSQRMQLQGEVDRLKSLAPNWGTYQILTGPRASERRAAMFTQENQIAQQKIAEAQAKLETFEKQATLLKQQANSPRPTIQESPWYQFQADLLNRSQDRAMAARGLTGSGFEAEERRRGLIELGAGETERQFGRLSHLYDVGANTAAQGANILSGSAQQVANLQNQAGQIQGQGIMGVAGANAGMATGIANSITGAVGSGLNYMQFQNLINANKPNTPYTPTPVNNTGGISSYNGFMVNTPK